MADRQRDNGFVYAGAALAALATLPYFDAPEALALRRLPAVSLAGLQILLPEAILLAAALVGPSIFSRGRFGLIARVLALGFSAYVAATVVLATVCAWLDFTGRLNEENFAFPGWVMAFFAVIANVGGNDVTFFLITTLAAALLAPFVWWASRSWSNASLTERLARVGFFAALWCLALLIGSMMATTVAHASSMGDPASEAFRGLLAVILATASALAFVSFANRVMPCEVDASKNPMMVSAFGAASRTVALIVTLLLLGVFQVSGYVERVSLLREARLAFAEDLIQSTDTSDAAMNSQSRGRRTSGVAASWAEIDFSRPLTPDGSFIVDVHELSGGENWTVGLHLYGPSTVRKLDAIADRLGLAFEPADAPVALYPRVARELRSNQIRFPGTDIALDLTTFTLLVPLVVIGGFIALLFRIRGANLPPTADRAPWLLIDAQTGVASVLALLWLGALGVGPWALSVLVVEAVSLILRAKNSTPAIGWDGVAFAYSTAITVSLALATTSAVACLRRLRRQAAQTER